MVGISVDDGGTNQCTKYSKHGQSVK